MRKYARFLKRGLGREATTRRSCSPRPNVDGENVVHLISSLAISFPQKYFSGPQRPILSYYNEVQ
jgi:hypothetical protein